MRDRLSYANVMATIAVFLALGGTSYALTLPRNSVGKKELRPDSVGRSELRREAVGSSEIVDRSVGYLDMSTNARNALRGQVGPRGPAGPTVFASINAAGEVIRGNALQTTSPDAGARLVQFGRQLSDCVATATLVGGLGPTTGPGADARVELGGSDSVLVRTFNALGENVYLPFNLIVAC